MPFPAELATGLDEAELADPERLLEDFAELGETGVGATGTGWADCFTVAAAAGPTFTMDEKP